MIPIDELAAENEEIINLCEVLNVLIMDPAVSNNPVVCELMDRFMERINQHLQHEDRSVYPELLSGHGEDAKNMAMKFISNAHELRRILKHYEHDWCNMDHSNLHNEYVKESNKMFELVCERVHYESNNIFPLFKK